ncbi:hypothetical protein [Mucilaginibacter myungsuensis]|uniref:Spy/CpxP family protein refolding chaperone n=1 Tax=Mucilaginibacter myungsuensis TaxID=649104 RepID=A0A929KZL3_9SPHI|nr:hypothetical protein [Mucilaginibacter myungsuensis]MBE9664629.1 hypothetical protein [Mucilaginibacter myungsuensis]MDN3601480.1 hypothetical protein [Mucilaginibacter myungsuensis]
MKALKYLTIIGILISSVAINTASAQDKDAKAMMKESTPEQRAKLQTGMMKTKLRLDSATVTKVQAINLKYAQKLDPVMKGDGRKLKMIREAMSIQKEKDAELKTALSKDQYQAYEKMKDDMRDKIKEFRSQN